LDPAFLGKKPVPEEQKNSILGRRFGIPIEKQSQSQTKEWSIRPMSNYKTLQMYSISTDKLTACREHAAITAILDNGLPFSIPWKLCNQTITILLSELGIFDQVVHSGSEHCDTIRVTLRVHKKR